MKRLSYLTALAAMALPLFLAGCEEQETPRLPAAAGQITVSTVDDTTVLLSVDAIEYALTYRWYKDGAEVQNTPERTYTATGSGMYSVAGVNDDGEGARSPEVEVTIVREEPEPPVVEFNILTEEYIPDPLFRQYVKDSIAGGADTFTNLQAAEYNGAINLPGSDVASLVGVGYFTSVTDLNVNSSSLTELDLNSNKELVRLDLTDCRSLSTLEIDSLEKLEILNLDFTGLQDLEFLTEFGSVGSLKEFIAYLPNCNQETLDLTRFENLEVVNVDRNRFYSIDVSNLSKLRELSCSYQFPDDYWRENGLRTLSLSGCVSLSRLTCSFNILEELDLSTNTGLMQLFCQENPGLGARLDISHLLGQLTELNVRNTGITSLDLSGSPQIERLQCELNPLEQAPDLTDKPNLTFLRIEGCGLTGLLSIPDSPLLTELYCYDNDLSYIDISGCTEGTLSNLQAFNNPNLKEIKVWPDFDMENPPRFNVGDAEYVYEFTE